MKNYMIYTLGLILLSFAIPSLAKAGQSSDQGIVAVGGETVLVLHAASGGMTIKQRVDAVQERLVTILSAPRLGMRDIVKEPLKGNAYQITVKGHLLVTVTAQDAAVNKTTTRKLADIWLEHLRKVLPQLNAKPNPNMENK
jgi:hypothetical protein